MWLKVRPYSYLVKRFVPDAAFCRFANRKATVSFLQNAGPLTQRLL